MRNLILGLFICLNLNLVFSQQFKKLDVKNVDVEIKLDTITKSVAGKVKYQMSVLENLDSLYLDAKNMKFGAIKINDEFVEYKATEKFLVINKPFSKGSLVLDLEYEATPKQTLYFFGFGKTGKKQIWTQGQGKYTSHWLPSFDNENQKSVYSLKISFDKKYTVVSNGALQSKVQISNNEYQWFYKMEKPMSAYLLAFAIGDYKKN